MQSTLSSKGQITIPARIREALGLKVGDKLDFRLKGNGMVELEVVSGSLADLKGILPPPKRRLSLKEIEEAIGQGGE